MKLLFLGVYSFMTLGKDLFQANMIIESDDGSNMLIDCGSDIRHSLLAQGYTHKDMDAVYISHLHSDHIGGLEWFGFTNYFKEKRRPKLYVSPDQKTPLWDNALSAGMSSLEEEQAHLDTYFETPDITNDTFYWGNYKFTLIKTHHTSNNGHYLPSYGLFIELNNHKIFITTDARFTPDSLLTVYNKADIIFQDCETSGFSGQHARYEQLCQLDDEIKNKMWLYGYSNSALPDAKKDGFKGFVTQGQSFEFK